MLVNNIGHSLDINTEIPSNPKTHCIHHITVHLSFLLYNEVTQMSTILKMHILQLILSCTAHYPTTFVEKIRQGSLTCFWILGMKLFSNRDIPTKLLLMMLVTSAQT